MSATFKVNDVEGKKSWYEPRLVEMKSGYEGLGKFEAMGGPEKIIAYYGPRNGLWVACHDAYNAHMPLMLSPDHIWATIARVAAQYIVAHSSDMRDKIVKFKDRKLITVRRDDFVKGSDKNPWPEAFEAFRTALAKELPEQLVSVFTGPFSTTGPVEQAVHDITLMDAVSKFFKYEMMTMSGIPEITLSGEPEDWVALGVKALHLTALSGSLGEWAERDLLPLLDMFIEASRGNADREWWRSFFVEFGGSGGSRINGHITKLLPKVVDGEIVVSGKDVSETSLSESFSKVPFLWKHMGSEFRMRLVAGVSFATIINGHITPAASWAVEEV